MRGPVTIVTQNIHINSEQRDASVGRRKNERRNSSL